ncbi:MULTISPECIES: hypothetical protein [Parafrankia]|uniref:Uncharacterized protein n=1 Tax=Parafrankia soli TaxID=2599596 RepID=A0A1S1PMF2_9ACTN|nr:MULTISPECIES: hypothetical protein [Parafrankia]OHV22451.1 hypothetical protein BBK14_06635 [Parafrankia soli]TCJ32765.1 hypothetical protein E0504_41075 [Parafrankia sp. BMG5.11]CAI7975752.1 conserved hypothetical protein [Frankia sp. Hr75.2]SQD96583.1 conserved hypothetical protein [Parafrankia sp. Ea1.12]
MADDSPHSKKLQELMFRAWETFGDARHLDSDDRVFVQALARQTADRISVLYGASWREALDWVAQRYVPTADLPGGTTPVSPNGAAANGSPTVSRRGTAAAEVGSTS